MKFTETPLAGAYVIDLEPISDERGYFARAWCAKEFEAMGLNARICQINASRTKRKGTIRGLHYQVDPHQECKIVRCTAGCVYDVMIDLRPDSSSYLRWFGTELSRENGRAVYVPENFAHGMLALEDNSEITYPVTEFYTTGAERGIRHDDPTFAISWPIPVTVCSEKDASHPDFVPERS